MEPAPTPKNKWTLTQNAFELLLAQLDADRDQAGAKYELLRRKLVKFFEWRGCAVAEDLADDTINRVARNLESGEKIRDFGPYCAGTARRVYLEHLRQREREQTLQTSVVHEIWVPEQAEQRDACLQACLHNLSGKSLRLILSYYVEEKQRRIEARKKLADEIGIPLNALRIRAYRIRAELEDCVRRCLAQGAEGMK